MAAREEGVLSLCFSSSLKLFNLSERRRDVNKLHPKVGHSCEKQWEPRGPQGRPVCRTSSLLQDVWGRNRHLFYSVLLGKTLRKALRLHTVFVVSQPVPLALPAPHLQPKTGCLETPGDSLRLCPHPCGSGGAFKS